MSIPRNKIKHKFGAIRCERDNIKFPSKLERACYDWLKTLQGKGEIRFFLRQIPFDIPGGGKHVIDFAVFTSDEVVFIEAKGRDLQLGRLKRKQVEDLYGIEVYVVKSVSELIRLLESL